MAGRRQFLLIPLVLCLGICAGALAMLGLNSMSPWLKTDISRIAAAQSVTPGTDILHNFKCRGGETKRVYIRGVEDNYSTATLEPTSYDPAAYPTKSPHPSTRRYDETGFDNDLHDIFDFEANIAGGQYVVKMRSLHAYNNDTLTFSYGEKSLYHNITRLKDDASWVIQNDVHSVNIGEDLRFSDVLLGKKKNSVIVKVKDDHQVDFMGFAICYEPEQKRGLTHKFMEVEGHKSVVRLTCGNDCNPHAGDTECHLERPLACFKPAWLPVPEGLSTGLASEWNGGHMKFTEPVRGDMFALSDDAHAYCRESFGDDWRVANLGEILSYGTAPSMKRAWVDPHIQKYGACWARRGDKPRKQHHDE